MQWLSMATHRPSMPVPDFCFVLSALRGTVICLSFWGTLSPEAAVTEHPDGPGFAQGPLWVYHRLGAAGRVGVAGASERRAEHAPGPTVAPETIPGADGPRGDIIFALIVPDIQRYHAVFGMVKLETSHVVVSVHASWGGYFGLEPRVVPCFSGQSR